MSLNISNLGYDKCEDEPIHIPESIQSYGYLVAVEPTNKTVKIQSENVEEIFEGGLLGKRLFDLMDEDLNDFSFIEDTFARAREQKTRLPVEVRFKSDAVSQNHPFFSAVLFESEGLMVFELEPDPLYTPASVAKQYSRIYAMNISPRFKKLKSLEEMAQSIVDTMKSLTGFERVVLYKFNLDKTGQVIAEAKEDDMDSYLGLFYPASDIPRQARELYVKNWIRLTPNVDMKPSALVPKVEKGKRKPLDLTQSLLRTMSPIHLQYIRNQGLKSSMSISLVAHGKLWGLVSCHHRKEHYLPQNIRLDCENLGQLFSWHLYAKEEELYFQKREAIDRTINTLVGSISAESSIIDLFRAHKREILGLMDAQGFVFKSARNVIKLGDVPEDEVLEDLVKSAQIEGGEPWRSDCLMEEKLVFSEGLGDVKGALIIPLARDSGYYTAWFRGESPSKQRWAGVNKEEIAGADKKERLTPRTSFEVREIQIRNRSKRWSKTDLEIAERFHKLFLSHALTAQDKMRASIENLEEKDQFKDEFMATLAHELRNPLSPISAAVSLLDESQDKDTVQTVVETVKRQLKQMTTLVDDLMDVSRIGKGAHITLKKQKLDLDEILEHAVETASVLIKEKNHRLLAQLPEEKIWVCGDFARLAQVFGNLLNNAAKYTGKNGEISVTAWPKEGGVEVRVGDNGLGISKEDQGRIFDMYNQAHSPDRSRGGLGIGLTLVKSIVELHEGRIEVFSPGLGKGSVFSVWLPAESGQVNIAKKASNRALSRPKEKQSVLLVDDNEDIVSLLKMFLEKQNFDVYTAFSGSEALKVFEKHLPSYGILDIGLPDMDGKDLCRKLKSIKPDARFLAQSGWGMKKDIQESLEAGFEDHLVKPASPGSILRLLKVMAEKERT